MTIFAERTVVELIVGHFLLPMMGALVLGLTIGGIAKVVNKYVKPPVHRWWVGSAIRAHYRALSRAWLLFLIGLSGNLAVLVLCLPLLRIPVGSAIKPMVLPLLFIIIASVTGVACRILREESRPPGFVLLRIAAVILCLMPLPTGAVLMNLFAAMRGLEFG